MSDTSSGQHRPPSTGGGSGGGNGVAAAVVLVLTFLFIFGLLGLGYELSTALLAAGLAGGVAYEIWKRFRS